MARWVSEFILKWILKFIYIKILFIWSSFNEDNRFNLRKYTYIKEDTILVVNSITGKYVKSWGANM